MIKSFCERFLQYKHARRYMEFLETTLFNVDNYCEQYKRFRKARQKIFRRGTFCQKIM